ncbi:hypothetical protein JW905_17835 [bacterium]|nr:hypothetical protein [candidate division CSSED10-310 bacterium]
MKKVMPMLICAFLACGTSDEAKETENYWEAYHGDGFSIVIPSGWRKMPSDILFLNGDGIGGPIMDETGSPLQIGFMIEFLGQMEGTLRQAAGQILESLEANHQFKVEKKEVQEIRLSDGTEGILLITRFIKDEPRRSLYLKLLTKDHKGNGWIANAWIVAGRTSAFATAHSEPARRLRLHLASFCFDDAKLDISAIDQHYKALSRKQDRQYPSDDSGTKRLIPIINQRRFCKVMYWE